MNDFVLCDFPPTDRAAWAAAVERATGVPPEHFRSRPERALVVEPIYVPADAPTLPLAPRPATPWTTAQAYAMRDPSRVAAALSEDRRCGLEAAWLRLSPAIRTANLGRHAAASPGIELHTLRDVEVLLEHARAGVRLRVVAGAGVLPVLTACATAARGRPLGETWVLGDPLGAVVELGPLGIAMEDALAHLVEATAWAAREAPTIRTIVASGLGYHDAGASAVVELAAVVATGVAYLRAAIDRGLSADAVVPRMVLRFGVGSDVFIELAKLRAARWLWTRVARRCGASPGREATWIAVRGGWRDRSRHDPWVNQLRATVETFAAVAGGADEIAVQPYDEPIRPPTRDARRWALGIQHVLREESSLDKVGDPAAGSGYVEALTRRIAEEAWTLVREIEAAGGMPEALRRGRVQAWVREDRARRRAELARGKAVLTGTSAFVDLDEPPVELGDDPAPPVPGEVEPAAVQRRATAFDTAHAAFEQGATLDAVLGALGGRGGEAVETLDLERLAAPFEQLRARADRYRRRIGTRPTAIVGVVGSTADEREHVGWVRARLHAAGFEVQTTAAEGMEQAVAQANAKVAVVCGSTPRVSERAADLAPTLRGAGARAVVLASDSPEAPPAGVTQVLGRAAEVLEVLASLQDAAEVDR